MLRLSRGLEGPPVGTVRNDRGANRRIDGRDLVPTNVWWAETCGRESRKENPLAINWDKKVYVLETWGAALGGLFLVTQIFKGELFSGSSSFGENVLLAVFTFLLPPLGVFLFYWPQTQVKEISGPPAVPPKNSPIDDSPPSTQIPPAISADKEDAPPQRAAAGWNKKTIIFVVIAILVAYKIITSLYIGHKKAELNDLLHQLQLQQEAGR